ncbi:MAG: recombinase family protein [Actinomycetota bacterium]
MQAILYCRTSTDEQRNGTTSQRERLIAHAEERGTDYTVSEEHASGKTLARRPVLRAVLDKLDALGSNGVLCVAKLDRLARSTRDFASILERAERKGWSIVVLDLGGERLDTSTAMGKAMARMAMVMAELESELIGERTKEALAVVKAAGTQLGHPSTVTAKTQSRIAELRGVEGLGYRAIADRLNAEGVRAPSGRKAARWHATSVKRHERPPVG